jgi:uncharacterized protein with HEPN domain
MRSDIERLKDIAEAVAAVEKYATRGRSAFEKDELIQTWVLHHLLILGEAAAKISDEFKEKHTEIPWSKVVGMRNILVHNYFGIDFDVVWGVVESDLPQLKKLLGQIV